MQRFSINRWYAYHGWYARCR